MQLGHPINVRFPLDTEARLRATADALGEPIGVFLRKRIMNTGLLEEELEKLTSTVETLSLYAPSEPGSERAILLELLLLLRASVSPQERARAQSEVTRHGLKIWSGDSYNASR